MSRTPDQFRTPAFRRTTQRLLLAGTAALAACGSAKADDPATASAPPPATILRRSDLIVADSSSVESGPVLSGSLRPKSIAVLRAQLGGRVLDVLAEQGQAVRKGELLVSIDPAALNEQLLSSRAAVRSAEVARDLAKRNQERNDRLVEAGAIADQAAEQTRSALLQAEAALDDAKARLRGTEEQLTYAKVRAPFAGLVTEQPVNPGDVITPGTALMTVVNPSLLELEATVPVEALPTLRRGATVSFTSSALPNQRFTGTIDRINPALEAQTRQVQLYVNVANPQGRLVAGLFVEGRVASQQTLALALPANAVDERGGSPSVLKLERGVVVRTPVEILLRDAVAEKVAISKGLAKGDTVLVGGALTVSPGVQVRVQADQ